jgi:diadenosine tetraphosphate (Ap4A) HIT family hydrolase
MVESFQQTHIGLFGSIYSSFEWEVGEVMVRDPTCIFCRIVSGESEASIIFQDELVTVFLDTNPLFKGHMLIVPNTHFIGLSDLDDNFGQHMFVVARRLAKTLLLSSLNCEGINLFLADGVTAGQSVFHSHLHVIPRHFNDGFRIQHPEGYGEQPTRDKLDEVAEQLREVLDQESY